MITTTKKPNGRPRRADLTLVQVRLCSHHCTACLGEHWTDAMQAERLDANHVRIVEADPVWRGCELANSDYRFV